MSALQFPCQLEDKEQKWGHMFFSRDDGPWPDIVPDEKRLARTVADKRREATRLGIRCRTENPYYVPDDALATELETLNQAIHDAHRQHRTQELGIGG